MAFNHIINSTLPIGSVEFVNEFLSHFYGKELKPTNIPLELRALEFTDRVVFDGNECDIKDEDKMVHPNLGWFVKSNDKIKSYANMHRVGDNIPVGNYQYSTKMNIESEWRAFIYKGKLVGLNNYTGDFTKFPNVELVNRMIDTYKSAPIAYTLDVGIELGRTFIIEVHPFIGCGTYNFNNLGILPSMFDRAFNEIINEKL